MAQTQPHNTVIPLAPTAWRPDWALIDAALDGRIHATRDLAPADRAWLIAQLTCKHRTAKQIADKLHCSERLVKHIRTEPVAVLTTQLLTLQKQPARKPADRTSHLLNTYAKEIDQLRQTRNQLIDALAATKAKCQQTTTTLIYLPHKYRRHPKPPAQPTLF